MFPSIAIVVLCVNCSAPLVQTKPELFSDTGAVTIICNGASGNKGLLNIKEPVYVHPGLITDSSVNPDDWRYVKFKWGSTEEAALTKSTGNNSWSFTIRNIRQFFAVPKDEKIINLAILFRTGNCIDTNCHVLRNEDKSNIYLPLNGENKTQK